MGREFSGGAFTTLGSIWNRSPVEQLAPEASGNGRQPQAGRQDCQTECQGEMETRSLTKSYLH